MSILRLGCCGGVEVVVNSSGEVALEPPSDVSISFAFGAAFLNVGSRFWVVNHPVHGDDDERAIELPAATSVKPVSHGVVRGCLQWAGSS